MAWGVHSEKLHKVHYRMIEGMTHLTLQQYPSTPRAATVTNIKSAAVL